MSRPPNGYTIIASPSPGVWQVRDHGNRAGFWTAAGFVLQLDLLTGADPVREVLTLTPPPVRPVVGKRAAAPQRELF